MERYVYPVINNYDTVTVTFDLWMLRAGYDTFAVVVNFVEKSWVPQHVTMGIFNAPTTSRIALAEIVKSLLEQFKLQTKVIAYVKDEGSNMKTLEITLSANISCDVLRLHDSYASVYFGHVMSKAAQYATTEDKVCMKMKEVSFEDAQATL
jgi:hypothetical protein